MEKTPNVDFIAPFLVDDSLLFWSQNPKTDVGKAAKVVLDKMNSDPLLVTEQDMKDVVWANGSQIGKKEDYWTHITDVSGIYKQISEMLLSKNSDFDLLEPNLAAVHGLIHDLDSIVAKYGGEYKGYKFAQHDKQLTEYFLFKGLGLDKIAQQVPIHCAYFEVLDMIAKGEGFPEVAMYSDWRNALNDPLNPLNFSKIKQDFKTFLEGKSNLPLIALVVSDYMDNGKPSFALATVEADFAARRDDILKRYYHNQVEKGETPPALGKALVELGGINRVNGYFAVVKDLLEGNVDKYRETHQYLFKQSKQKATLTPQA